MPWIHFIAEDVEMYIDTKDIHHFEKFGVHAHVYFSGVLTPSILRNPHDGALTLWDDLVVFLQQVL